MNRLLVVTVLLAIAPAATSEASSLRVATYGECNGDFTCSKYMMGTPATAITYVAAQGERNALVAERAPDGRVRFRDAGATIEADPACERVSPNEAICPSPTTTTIQLGDQDDTAAVAAGPGTTISGEDGDDVLDGGPAAEVLDGGRGDDTVRGGGGDDTLVGTLDGDRADRLDGGDGIDTVGYAGRREHVVVDLSRTEGFFLDTLESLENAIGGEGNDTLVGSDGPNRLEGGQGDDRVTGAGGDDDLDGGPGRDKVGGGDGADHVASYDGERDLVACGAGRDAIFDEVNISTSDYEELAYRGADAVDRLARDCESTALNGSSNDAVPLLVRAPLRFGSARVSIANPCVTLRARRCSGSVRVGDARKRFGRRGARIVLRRTGATGPLGVRLAVRVGERLRGAAWTADPTLVG